MDFYFPTVVLKPEDCAPVQVLALKDYYMMTGYPALIPRYALGNWWSRNITYDDESTHELIRSFERKKIPISVMVFDHDWHIREYQGDKNVKSGFTFNTGVFSNPI